MTNKTINVLTLSILALLLTSSVLAATPPNVENIAPDDGTILNDSAGNYGFECNVTKGSGYISNNITFTVLLIYKSSDNSTLNISKDNSPSGGLKSFTVYVPLGDYTYRCVVIDKALNIAVSPKWDFRVTTEGIVTTSTTTSSLTTTTRRKGGGGGGGGGGGMTPTGGGTCFDGLKNCHHHQCEEDVDCGGPCQPCPSCSDGIQNQGETGVDCGGPCGPCPTTTTIKGLPNITTTTTTQVPMRNETTTTSTTLVGGETSTTLEGGGAVGRIVGIQLREAALLGIVLLLIFLAIFLISRSKKKKSPE